MGDWYNPLGHYLPEQLVGLPIDRLIEAVDAEGGRCLGAPSFRRYQNERIDQFLIVYRKVVA